MKDLSKELRKAKVEEPDEISNQIPKHFAEKLNTIFVDISKFSEATQSMETMKHYIIKSGDQQYPLIYTHFFFDQHNMLEKIIRKQWSNYLKNTPHIKYAVYFQAREVMCSLSNQFSFFSFLRCCRRGTASWVAYVQTLKRLAIRYHTIYLYGNGNTLVEFKENSSNT